MTFRIPPRAALVVSCLVLTATFVPEFRAASSNPAFVPITDPLDLLPARSGSGLVITDPLMVLPLPALGRPQFLVPMRDPVFGTTITRITGDTGKPVGGAIPGTWGADARHAYSKQQPWNADGTLLIVQNRGSGTPSRVILDGKTYWPKLGPCANDVLYDYRWHPSRARATTMINVDREGRELSWFDVETCEKTRTWQLPITVDYGIGSGEGNPSYDGRFVALGNDSQMFVVDMDPKPPFAPWPNVRIGPLYDILPCSLDVSNPSSCRIGNLSISPSGKYVDLKFSGSTSETQDIHRIFDVDPTTLGLRPRAMADASLRCESFQRRPNGWIHGLKHADMALDPYDGFEDVIIGGRSCPGSTLGRVVKVRLRDGKVTALSNPSGEPSVQHVSTRNTDRPGWAYVGYYRAEGKRFSDEIVAVRLDGGAVERLSHKRSASSSCYRCESHPVPSRDGRRVLFASNWAQDCGLGCGSPTDIKDYVVTLPTGGEVPIGVPVPTSPGVALAFESLRPNPAVGHVSIDYALGVDEAVRLELLDVAGRRVRERDLGRPGPGYHHVDLARGRDLPPGVYWVRLRAGANQATSKIIFVG